MGESVFTEKIERDFLSRSQQGKMINEVSKYIINGIANGGGSVQIPVLQRMFEVFPEFKQSCIDIYNGVFGLNEYVTAIPDDIKASQGAVLDGLCFMYDWNKGESLGLVTLNNRLIEPNAEEVVDSKVEAKMMEKNRVGLILSYRYDFDYSQYGPDVATVKCVKHRTEIDEENVTLVPLVAILALCEIIKSQLSKDRMLAMKQVISNGEIKVRVITESFEHLSHYCDDPEACSGLSSEYYPLGSFMYAPVLGAPSTTAMKTRIDFFNLEDMMVVTKYSQCARFGIQKVKDPVNTLLKDNAILAALADMKVASPDAYTRFITSLPDSYVFKNMADGDISIKTFSNYLHTVTEGKGNELLKKVPGAVERYERLTSVINDEGKSTIDPKDLYNTLRRNIVKVIWKKPNGVYASSVCTNCNDILKKVYGDDYFGKYESVGVRISNAVDDITTLGMPVDVACKTYGFNQSVAKWVDEYMRDGNDDVESAFYVALGKKKSQRTKNENLITARTLGSYLGEKFDEGESSAKAEDYYVSIDTTHIVRAEVIG